jgi:hypothetical protein
MPQRNSELQHAASIERGGSNHVLLEIQNALLADPERGDVAQGEAAVRVRVSMT